MQNPSTAVRQLLQALLILALILLFDYPHKLVFQSAFVEGFNNLAECLQGLALDKGIFIVYQFHKLFDKRLSELGIGSHGENELQLLSHYNSYFPVYVLTHGIRHFEQLIFSGKCLV